MNLHVQRNDICTEIRTPAQILDRSFYQSGLPGAPMSRDQHRPAGNFAIAISLDDAQQPPPRLGHGKYRR